MVGGGSLAVGSRLPAELWSLKMGRVGESRAVLRPRVRPGGVDEEKLWKEVFPSKFGVAVPARWLLPM